MEVVAISSERVYVVGPPSDNAIVSLHVITKDTGSEKTPGSEQCINMPKYLAEILPFIENENTYDSGSRKGSMVFH